MKKTDDQKRFAALKCLESYSKGNLPDDPFPDGSSFHVDLKVTGTVDGHKIREVVFGQLSVGTENPTGSTKRPDSSTLIAAAIDLIPKTKLKKLLALKKVPTPSSEAREAANALVVRHSTKGPKRGAKRFIEKQSG